MKNIDRIAKFVTKNGSNGLMVHTISGTKNWIIAQKIDINKWLISLLNPMGNVTFNLGTVNDEQHLQLWLELTKQEIENKTNQIAITKELKKKIQYFLKNYEQTYKKFTYKNKISTKKSKISTCKNKISTKESKICHKDSEKEQENNNYIFEKNTKQKRIKLRRKPKRP